MNKGMGMGGRVVVGWIRGRDVGLGVGVAGGVIHIIHMMHILHLK